MKLYFKRLSDLAQMPKKFSISWAAYDLFSTESYLLAVGERYLFKTNIAVQIPVWTYGRIAPRSGLAYKYGIDVMAWVIDADYRWDIGVLLINLWKKDVQIESWERIGQLIIEKCFDVDWVEVESLEDSCREKWAYGSTWRF